MFKKLKEIKERLGDSPEYKSIYLGMLNFWVNDSRALKLAKERTQTCTICEHFIEEKNDLLKVKDDKIPQLSNKQCGDCGCVLSYKLRQSEKKCKKWQK